MNIEYLKKIYSGKRVFLTGHTGFKGAWMLQILQWLGADVKGYALKPENEGDLYNEIGGDNLCYASVIADIRDLHTLQGEMIRFQPHFVFHLAAQSLVRRSYEQPVDTFAVNVIGTANVLEAMRGLENPCTGVIITTDKVYENPERGLPFKEDDKLGGYDPYSASKAAAEIVISSYERSFFNPEQYAKHGKAIASVRAGNVIGGGDYAEARIIPDIVRALDRGGKVILRNPQSVRPWQHVLEPLAVYLMLGAKMSEDPQRFAGAYNVGPDANDEKTVEELTKIFLSAYGKEGFYEIDPPANAPHEAKLLLLDSAKVRSMLEWHPKLNAASAIYWTAEWYADKQHSQKEKTLRQIEQYFGS
ncbi:CDP-glucose 4,6-dehydratase [Taibaiella soli]|uniref:CDP-glucose 4,6-dehydratase n=1 Tax=Taibaiella soli TaxID=1649169 RepID=A0A2W2AQ37_9BACT|nr:CDP-glucose 4,6-dehydratase [Taibaiella soli]PZF74530.1 CDP-glucose 4,6-dehydratase [Taibaiella soli]